MLDHIVCLVIVILQKDYALLVVLIWRLRSIFDDKRTCGGYGLEADVRVIEVGPGVVGLRVNLVVEALERCNGPLRDRRTVAERCGTLGEAMPVLEQVSIDLRSSSDKVVGPWLYCNRPYHCTLGPS